MTQLKDYLQKAEQFLRKKEIEKPRLEAQILFSYVLNMPRIMLYTRDEQPLERTEVDQLRELLVRKGNGEPTAYITGKKEFFSRDFVVNNSVLIPRPETEELVEIIKSTKKEYDRVLDLGCGSGCLGITLVLEKIANHTCLADLSSEALETAQLNAQQLLGEEQYSLTQSDLGDNLLDKSFDLIVTNPPYVTSAEYNKLHESVKSFEPRLALEVPDPEAFFCRLFKNSLLTLSKDGTFYMESSPTLITAQKKWALNTGFKSVRTVNDLSGKERFLIANNNE